MFSFTHRQSRPATSKLLDMVEEGAIDRDTLIRDLLGYMSESDVAQFARANDYLQGSDEDEAEDEDQSKED